MKNFLSRAFVLIIAVALFAWFISNKSGRSVTAEEFGDQWPFTVDRGVVDCVDDLAYTFKANGKVYALNGFATAWLEARDLHEIWKRDPKNPDLVLYINIHYIQKAAEAEC
ncbi:MAG: DUF2511 domain-containing protein [Rhodobacteraceae bacterium]|nr:DUF2511 domain-containing protein [Paracoccaceae bacterium]